LKLDIIKHTHTHTHTHTYIYIYIYIYIYNRDTHHEIVEIDKENATNY
jgi:hypothetical protein